VSTEVARALQPDPPRNGTEGRRVSGRTDGLDCSGLAHRRRIRFSPGKLSLASPECVILFRLGFWRERGSEKHLRDVRAMLATGLALDQTFLDAELRRRGLEDAWRQVAESH